MSHLRREELIREGEVHPSPEEIARLLGADSGEGEGALRAHLRVCRRCFALYCEMAEADLSSRWRSDTQRIPPELLETVKVLGSTPAPASFRFRPTARIGWIIVAAAVVVVAAFVVPHPWSPRPSDLSPARLEPVRVAIAQASRTGMVLTEEIAVAAPPTRSGAANGGAALATALDELGRAYMGDRVTEEAAYWLAAGMMAEGDPGAANILEEALARYPQSTRIANLAAVLDYRGTHLAEAERRLRGILERHPRDPVALFNLGLLLDDEGRHAELVALRGKLDAALERGSALRGRAEAEFGPLGG